MIGIIDYGLGNLTSVSGATERLGFEPCVTGEVAELDRAEKLILPGVGAFADGMRKLRERELVEPLARMVLAEGKPILGICLGAHLIAKESDEFGRSEGLGWVDARVVHLEAGGDALRIPHVGWNDLIQTGESLLFGDVPEDALFYYVHSFHIVPEDDDAVVGVCDYGGRFAAALQWRNIYATQFHPEKSQRHGLTLLNNFLERS